VLLTQSYAPAERFKAQALNDFLIFGVQAAAALSAGAVLFRTGWNTLVALTLPVLLGMAVAIFLAREPASSPNRTGQLVQKVAEENILPLAEKTSGQGQA